MMVQSEGNNELRIGSRVESDGHFATVCYIGEVPPTKGEWLGVEWDDPSRGKHDGTHEGTRFFTTRHGKSGSFVRRRKVTVGVEFMAALEERYGQQEGAGVVEEELFVKGHNQQITQVLLVGAQSVNQKQSTFELLSEVSLRCMGVARPGDAALLQSRLPAVQELDLSANLLTSWQQVATLTAALPKLHLLNVSENVLQLPDQPAELRPAFSGVKTLFLNRMRLEWQEVLAILEMFEGLENLHLCWNKIGSVERVSTAMEGLKLLNLESNPVRHWHHVRTLGALPQLEQLLVNDCGLSDILFPDTEPGQKTGLFPKLDLLSICHNKLDNWGPINELNKLQRLRQLKIRHNPLNVETAERSFEDIRYIITAKIESLQFLNATEIDGDHRGGAEIDYRKMFGRAWRGAGGHQDPAQNRPGAEFTAQHPRYQQLIDKYGAPDDAELKEHSSALKNSLIPVNIDCPQRPDKKILSKKLPASMTVQKLRALVMRLYKAEPATLKLSYVSEKTPGLEVEFEVDQKEITYYSIEEGDTILVKW